MNREIRSCLKKVDSRRSLKEEHTRRNPKKVDSRKSRKKVESRWILKRVTRITENKNPQMRPSCRKQWMDV